jgi:hypothetical protein
VAQASSNALKISSGTFELNNGGFQASLISIALAGAFLVENGTYALSMPISNDGQFILDSGTTVDITGALSGLGSFTINAGATLQFGTGTHTISGSTTDNGKVEVTDGTLEVGGAISGSGSLQVDAGAALQLDGADSLNVAFTGSTGKLILKDPGNFSGTISGLTGSDQIDLANINWQAAQVSSVNYSSTTNVTTLVITDGQHTSTILLVGDYTNSTWTFSSDGSGGTIVVDPLKTVVALSVTDSTSVADPTISSSDPAHSSTSTAADDATTGDASNAPSAEALIFSVVGLDVLGEHIRFGDADARPTAAVSVVDIDSNSSSHSGLVWLADFVHGEANDHFATLRAPDWALNLQSDDGSQSAQPGVAHVELENSNGGNKDLGFTDPPSQAVQHIPSVVAAADPNDGMAQPSLPIPAADAPSVGHDDHGPAMLPAVASDKPTFDHNDAPTADPDPGHAGLARHADDLSSQSGEHDLSDTSANDKPAFEHKDVASVDSNPGHADSAAQHDVLPSQSMEHKLSDTPEDGGAGHPHQSLSPIATASLSDDGTIQSAAHSVHGHGDPAPQPIQLLSAAASPPSSDMAADSAAPDSAHHAASDLSGHAADPLSVHADAVPQLIAATTQAAAQPVASYMVSLPMDQFQFPDLNPNNAHKVEHNADLIVNPATTQTLLEATAPTDHSASLHDISTIPGTELLISHSHQAAVHAHNGIV